MNFKRGVLSKNLLYMAIIAICFVIVVIVSTLVDNTQPNQKPEITAEEETERAREEALVLVPREVPLVQMALEPTVQLKTKTSTEVETKVEVETTTVAPVPQTEPETVLVEPEVDRLNETERLRSFYKEVDCSYDMTQKMGISKERFVEILEWLPYDYAGVYEANAEFIWETAQKYNFNEFLIVGIMAQESGWCSNPVAPNNFSSQRISGSRYYSYDTPEEGIEVLAQNLAGNYLSENGKYYSGKSLNGIGVKYCEGNEWSGKILACINLVLKEYLATQ